MKSCHWDILGFGSQKCKHVLVSGPDMRILELMSVKFILVGFKLAGFAAQGPNAKPPKKQEDACVDVGQATGSAAHSRLQTLRDELNRKRNEEAHLRADCERRTCLRLPHPQWLCGPRSARFCSRCLKINCLIKSTASTTFPITKIQRNTEQQHG